MLVFFVVLGSLVSPTHQQEREDFGCKSHTDICLPDEFCAADGPNATRCVHCVTCRKRDTFTFDGLPCPKTCQCETNDDCPRGSTCSDYENGFADPPDGYRICQSCLELCGSGDPTWCPETCWCSTSADCPDNTYCGTQHNIELFPTPGICTSCTRGYGCAQFALMAKEQETCLEVCPDFQYECGSHADCHTNNDTSSWCSQNSKCNNCSSACWTEARRTGNLDDVSPYERFRTSIDLGCPETCCDWDGAYGDIHYGTTIGFCDPSLKIEFRVEKGEHPDWVNVDDFSKSKSCPVERLEFDDGLFPKIVTVMDSSCWDFVNPGICREANYTWAVILTETMSDGRQSVRFRDDWPAVLLVSTRSDSCGLHLLAQALKIIGIVLGVVLICCCYQVSRRFQNGTR